MDALEIRALLENGNSTEVAFVAEKSTDEVLAQTLSALANAGGGTLLIGVTKAGSIRGVRALEATCEQVLSAALTVTPPLVLPLPEQVTTGERVVVAAHVPRGLPHAYAVGQRYLIRDGPRNRSMQASEVHQLMARRGAIHFETQVPPDSALADLDWERADQYARRLPFFGQDNAQEALRQRACLAVQDVALRPTLAGLLLFGRLPSRWVPGAEIVAVRYPGSEMADQFVREDITGPLPDQIRRAEAFLRANTVQQVTLSGLSREEIPAYPVDVLREVVVNAVAHRDYTIVGDTIRVLVFGDRIEVYSPGRLPGHITVQNIAYERFSRNPVLVQVLADMGFVERLGYGIDRMLRLLQEAGQPAPHFEETAGGFRVTVYAKAAQAVDRHLRWAHLSLNPRQELALEYVAQSQRITNREYQRLCPDISAETIRRDLSDLVDKNVLLRVGSKRATYYMLKDASLARP